LDLNKKWNLLIKVIWRPAAILDLIDALIVKGHVNSPVALSESPLFRRKVSSVYDALVHGQLDVGLKDLLISSRDFAGPGSDESPAERCGALRS